MPLLRMWVHCPRASNALLPLRSNLVGYVRWDARSDRFPPCQTIIPAAFRSQSELPVSREQPRSLTASRLLVTYLDRDMEFVWTPEHLDKMSWHRSSSVQIKPLQPTNSFFSANLATIRIDRLDFQSGRRSRRQIVSESPSCERRLLWAAS